MEKWYYERNNEQVGPISEEQLLDFINQQVLKQDNLVWNEGMDNWQPISSIPILNLNKTKIAKSGNLETVADTTTFESDKIKYAGFWRRFVAIIIDAIILAIPIVILTAILFPSAPREVKDGINYIFIFIFGWLYYALYESSHYQATLGKQILGIKVTDKRSRKISFGKATGRYFGKFISGIILYIGYIMAAFTKKKQALHDMMADCLVVVK